MSRAKVEQIIPKLREVEVEHGRGKTFPEAVKKIGVTEQTYYCSATPCGPFRRRGKQRCGRDRFQEGEGFERAMKTLLAALCLCLVSAPYAIAEEPSLVRDVFVRINKERAQHRLKACSYNKTLETAAQAHAEWMARNRQMEHLQAPPGSFEEHRTSNHHPINRAINAGYIGWDEVFTVEKTPTGAIVHAKAEANEHVGEIIAAGWDAGHPATQTATVVKGWMNSPGHRREILTRRYSEMGVGVACTPDGKDTFWCVVLGDRKQ